MHTSLREAANLVGVSLTAKMLYSVALLVLVSFTAVRHARRCARPVTSSVLDVVASRFAQAADPRSLVPEHRHDVSSAQRAGAGNALAEVKRRVTLLKDHLKAEYRSTDDPFCIPCSNSASPRMLKRNETCEGLSLPVLESMYCPGTVKHFQVLLKSRQHVKRSWFKQFMVDGEGYCKARCQTAGIPYDDTNCCPVTMPVDAADDTGRTDRVDEKLDGVDAAEDESPQDGDDDVRASS